MTIGAFDESAKERLSALLDGELDAGEPAAACAIWAGHADARRDWHAWHLIGDVLRSEDLATDPKRDRQLCAALRARLQREAVVLAPARLATPRRGRWTVGASIAAGFVLVAGTFALVRTNDLPTPATIAQADRPVAQPVPVAEPLSPAGTDAIVADNRLIRDAQLDRYFAAHKQFAGTSALGVPSTFLRSATVDPSAR